MSLNLFRTHIMSNKTVQERTVDGLLQLIENERWELYKQDDCMILSIPYLFAYKPSDFSNKLNWEQVNSRQGRGFGL